VDWIHLARHRFSWPALMNAETELLSSRIASKYLDQLRDHYPVKKILAPWRVSRYTIKNLCDERKTALFLIYSKAPSGIDAFKYICKVKLG
jgi:hypothetical protein